MTVQAAEIGELLYADGTWYRVPFWIHQIKVSQRVSGKRQMIARRLKPAVAQILAAAMDQSAYRKAVKLNDGWFMFSAARATKSTGYSERVQSEHINTLIEGKIIQKKRDERVHGRRLLKINYDLLYRLALETDEASKISSEVFTSEESSGVNRGTPEDSSEVHQQKLLKTYTQTNTNRKEKTQNVAAARTTESASLQRLNGSVEKESDALSLARRLHHLLLTKRKIMRKVKNIHTWVKPFTELLSKRSLAQVEKALSWYEKHIGENQWIPQLYSASSFLTEFARLEDAMDRYKEQEKKNSDYGTWSNPIPTTIITLLKDKRSHVTNNPNLDWDLIHRIAKQRKCSVGELSVCILLDPNNGEEPVTIKHPNEQQEMMKKMGWTHPK